MRPGTAPGAQHWRGRRWALRPAAVRPRRAAGHVAGAQAPSTGTQQLQVRPNCLLSMVTSRLNRWAPDWVPRRRERPFAREAAPWVARGRGPAGPDALGRARRDLVNGAGGPACGSAATPPRACRRSARAALRCAAPRRHPPARRRRRSPTPAPPPRLSLSPPRSRHGASWADWAT